MSSASVAPAAAVGGAGGSAAPAAAAGGAGGKVEKSKNWLPCESNPDVMNAYLAKLGFPLTEYSVVDVLGTEDWAIEMVPSPALAVIMLFCIKDASEAHRAEEEARIVATPQHMPSSIYFLKQFVGNACGTIALIHAVANAMPGYAGIVTPAKGSFFEEFVARTAPMTADGRATALGEDESIDEAHEVAAEQGQSKVVSADDDMNQHFVAFIHREGHLYELDGRKSAPIHHGPTTPETLLADATTVIKQFMARDPEEVRFTMVALARTPPPEAEEAGGAGAEDAAIAAAMAASLA